MKATHGSVLNKLEQLNDGMVEKSYWKYIPDPSVVGWMEQEKRDTHELKNIINTIQNSGMRNVDTELVNIIQHPRWILYWIGRYTSFLCIQFQESRINYILYTIGIPLSQQG